MKSTEKLNASPERRPGRPPKLSRGEVIRTAPQPHGVGAARAETRTIVPYLVTRESDAADLYETTVHRLLTGLAGELRSGRRRQRRRRPQ
jgi:hypothetical protein